MATGTAAEGALAMVSIFDWEPMGGEVRGSEALGAELQLPPVGPNGERDGGVGGTGGAAGRAGLAAGRTVLAAGLGVEAGAEERTPAPVATPLNSSSSGSRRWA